MNETLQNAIAALVMAAIPILVAIAWLGYRLLARKWRLDATEAAQRVQDTAARNAALEAEQWRKREARQSRDVTPDAMLERATESLIIESEARGVPAPPAPIALIEAKIAEARSRMSSAAPATPMDAPAADAPRRARKRSAT